MKVVLKEDKDHDDIILKQSEKGVNVFQYFQRVN